MPTNYDDDDFEDDETSELIDQPQIESRHVVDAKRTRSVGSVSSMKEELGGQESASASDVSLREIESFRGDRSDVSQGSTLRAFKPVRRQLESSPHVLRFPTDLKKQVRSRVSSQGRQPLNSPQKLPSFAPFFIVLLHAIILIVDRCRWKSLLMILQHVARRRTCLLLSHGGL